MGFLETLTIKVIPFITALTSGFFISTDKLTIDQPALHRVRFNLSVNSISKINSISKGTLENTVLLLDGHWSG